MFIKKEVGAFDEVGCMLPKYVSNEVFNVLKDRFQTYYTFETDADKTELNVIEVREMDDVSKILRMFLK